MPAFFVSRRSFMFVRSWMSSPAVVLLAETPLPDAIRFMEGKRIHRIGVVARRGLLGLVSSADLYRLLATSDPWKIPAGKTLGDTVIPSAIAATEDLPVERAAEMMVMNHASALPVLTDGRLVGVIS